LRKAAAGMIGSQSTAAMPDIDESRGTPWEKLRLLSVGERRKCSPKGRDQFDCQLGGI